MYSNTKLFFPLSLTDVLGGFAIFFPFLFFVVFILASHMCQYLIKEKKHYLLNSFTELNLIKSTSITPFTSFFIIIIPMMLHRQQLNISSTVAKDWWLMTNVNNSKYTFYFIIIIIIEYLILIHGQAVQSRTFHSFKNSLSIWRDWLKVHSEIIIQWFNGFFSSIFSILLSSVFAHIRTQQTPFTLRITTNQFQIELN